MGVWGGVGGGMYTCVVFLKMRKLWPVLNRDLSK